MANRDNLNTRLHRTVFSLSETELYGVEIEPKLSVDGFVAYLPGQKILFWGRGKCSTTIFRLTWWVLVCSPSHKWSLEGDTLCRQRLHGSPALLDIFPSEDLANILPEIWQSWCKLGAQMDGNVSNLHDTYLTNCWDKSFTSCSPSNQMMMYNPSSHWNSLNLNFVLIDGAMHLSHWVIHTK